MHAVAILPAGFFVMFANQMSQNLRVGRRLKRMPGLGHSRFQSVVVLNHPVMHDRNFSGLIEVWMRILIRGRPMRCPAGVPQTDRAFQRPLAQKSGQAFVYFSFPLQRLRPIRLIQNGHPRAVITAIFQPPQALQNDGRRLLFTHVSNNPAHSLCLLARFIAVVCRRVCAPPRASSATPYLHAIRRATQPAIFRSPP
jgi:hypothetical protein